MARDGELPGEEGARVHRVVGLQYRVDYLGQNRVEVDLIDDRESVFQAGTDRMAWIDG